MKKDMDKKEKKVKPEETQSVKKPAKNRDMSAGYNKSDLNSELERLAEIFREELKNQGELDDDVLRDSQGIIYEDEVCQCCGERRKAKNSDYCKPCQEAMRKYPLSIPMLLVALVMIAFSVVSVLDFSQDFDGYYIARKAKTAASDKKMYSSIEYYQSSIDYFAESGFNAKGLKFECVDAMCDVMVSSEDILTTLEGALSESEARLPIYKERVKQYDELYVLNQTMAKMMEIYQDEAFADAKEDDEVYAQAMNTIGSLVDLEIVVPSLDGETRIYTGNEAAVKYCQYFYAYLMEKTDDVYYYIYEVYKIAPEYLCMYGYDLGAVSAQTGDFKTALDVAKALNETNVEDSTAYCIYSMVSRMKGNYDEAITWAEKGLEINTDDTELMRHKAMALVAKGDLETAEAVMEELLAVGSTDSYYATLDYAVYLVVENELGNTENADSIKAMFEEIPERVQSYLDGEMTAAELFTEGTGDVL